MFTGGDKDRRIIAHMQAEMRKQADQWRLAHEAQEDEETTFNSKKWVVRVVLIVVAALALFAGARQVFAQGAEPLRPDAGGPPEPFAEAMIAYRVGLYDLRHGDYDQAVERLSAAIEGIPEEVMACVPAYQDMYWVLGEAQEAAGLVEEALGSYQQWLVLAGDDAAPWTRVKVQELEDLLEAMLIADMRA